MGGVTPPPTTGAPDRAGRDPKRPWAPSPFMRLARTHAASVSGDALFAIGLAGSVFFSLDFNSARWRVALYLVLTIAPFAVAAPLIGPALDRVKGGRRWIVVGSLVGRAALCVLVVRHMDSLLFYPEAFGMLVLQKVYAISKSAIVPGTVRSDEELVEANSKLTVLSALAVVVAAVPGGLLLKVGGGGWSVALGAVVFAVGIVLALQMPATTVAPEPAGEAEKEELRSAGIVAAASAMGAIRGIVGFLAFMLAFAIKEDGALWELGVVVVAAQAGFFAGAVAAPRVRRLATEESILRGALVTIALLGVVTAATGGLVGAALLSMTVGATSSAAKQAFDAIVQRDAPDANRGRSFARFETRFQLVWVVGALVPIIIPIPAAVGFGVIAVGSAVAVVSYQLGLRRIRRGEVPVRRPLWGRWRRGRATQTGIGLALDDPTVVDGPVPGADPTVVGAPAEQPPAPGRPDAADPTVVSGRPSRPEPPSDPARRWMPPPPTTAPPTEDRAPAPTPASAGAEDASSGEPAEPPAEGPSHRRQGLLFGPDAWEDAPTAPPEP